jgi:hypothetical protein
MRLHSLKNRLEGMGLDSFGPFEFVLIVAGILVACNLAWVFFYTPGQTLWAALAASRLSIAGAESKGRVEEVDSTEVQVSISRVERVYTTAITHAKQIRTFHTPKPFAQAGESIAVLTIPRAAQVFVPRIEGHGYWDRLQLLADVSIVKRSMTGVKSAFSCLRLFERTWRLESQRQI